jgi:hypothetical protein
LSASLSILGERIQWVFAQVSAGEEPEPVLEEDLFADMAPKIRKQKKVFIGSGESRPLTQFQAIYQIKASFLKGTGSVN